MLGNVEEVTLTEYYSNTKTLKSYSKVNPTKTTTTTTTQNDYQSHDNKLTTTLPEFHIPRTINCKFCKTKLFKNESEIVNKTLPLPSPYWFELLDCWTCHDEDYVKKLAVKKYDFEFLLVYFFKSRARDMLKSVVNWFLILIMFACTLLIKSYCTDLISMKINSEYLKRYFIILTSLFSNPLEDLRSRIYLKTYMYLDDKFFLNQIKVWFEYTQRS